MSSDGRGRIGSILTVVIAVVVALCLGVGFSYDSTQVTASLPVGEDAGTAIHQGEHAGTTDAVASWRDYDDFTNLARASVRAAGYRLAPQATREVILDTNAVYGWQRAQGLLQAGDVPVITRTTQAEIRNLAAAGRMKPPGYLDDFAVIDDVMDANTRINIRGALRPGQRGIFGDGSIGATVVNRGSPVITFDRNFADVLRQFGVNVL